MLRFYSLGQHPAIAPTSGQVTNARIKGWFARQDRKGDAIVEGAIKVMAALREKGGTAEEKQLHRFGKRVQAALDSTDQ